MSELLSADGDAGIVLDLAELARVVGGRLDGQAGADARHYTADSRRVRPGSVFFALPGERTDGHRFLREVRDREAAAAVIEDDRVAPAGLDVIRVASPALALAALGRHFRGLGALRVVG